MTTERIKEIQLETAYPDSVSVQQALFKVWNECEQGKRQVNSVDLADVVKSDCVHHWVKEHDSPKWSRCSKCGKSE